MAEKFRNRQMAEMAEALEKHLDRRDVIGYAAARNTRLLREELTEYSEKIRELVNEHGVPDLDDGGAPTGSVSLPFGSDGFKRFMEAIAPFADIEHEPPIFKVKYSEAIGALSGKELLEIDWMFED